MRKARSEKKYFDKYKRLIKYESTQLSNLRYLIKEIKEEYYEKEYEEGELRREQISIKK